MYKNVAQSKVSKGNLLMLFNNKERFFKYLNCILIGMPLWFVVGILITQSPEFGRELGAVKPLSAGNGIMYSYIGISIGGLFAGVFAQITKSRRLSVFAQITKSRRLTMMIFQLLSLISVLLYLNAYGITEREFIWLCLFMGFSVGYWATFVTIASEQFGTNIRSTVTTTVPNFVRGALIPITFIFERFVRYFTAHGGKDSSIIKSGYVMMFIVTAIALFALSRLKESFSKDLDYIEEV
jgi:hypothetical protein